MKNFTISQGKKISIWQRSKRHFILVLPLLLFFLPLTHEAQTQSVKDYFTLPDAARCTSNDLDIISADLDLETCNCTEGTTVEAGLTLGVRNNTESLRTSFSFWAQLTVTDPIDDSKIYYMITGCEPEILPGNQYGPGTNYPDNPPRTKLATFSGEFFEIYIWDEDQNKYIRLLSNGAPATTIPYECGTSLEMTNIYQAWTDASKNDNRSCGNIDPSKINPKCGIIPLLNVGVGLSADSEKIADVTCNGDSDGSIKISFSGGKAPYYLAWNGGSYDATAVTSPVTKSNLSGSVAGTTYNWKIKDSSVPPCEKSGSEIIYEPKAVSLSISATNVTCNGDGDGSISGDSYDGTGTAAFYTSTDGTNFTLSSLNTITTSSYGAGDYWVRVAYDDGNGNNDVCYLDKKVTITEPKAVSLSISATNVTCNGDGDGSISVDSYDGTGTAAFYTSTDGTNFTLSSLNTITTSSYGAGDYWVRVAYDDGNGNNDVCYLDKKVTITEPKAVSLSISATNVTCNGDGDGSISVDSYDGTGTAAFYTSTDGTNFTLSSLNTITTSSYGAGDYWVRVAYDDGNGNNDVCYLDKKVTITEPKAVSLSISATNVTCNGDGDGSISVDSHDGTGTAAFYTSTDGTNFTLSSLNTITTSSYGAGDYWVRVAYDDGNGNNDVCYLDKKVTITEPKAVSLSISATNVTCNGDGDGSISVDSYDGTGTAAFYTSTDGTNFTLSSLNTITTSSYGAGDYWVRVAYDDGNGNNDVCYLDKKVTITEPFALLANGESKDETCVGGDGSVTITFSGGTSPYQISFDGGTATTETSPKTYSGLSAKTYSWKVIDANGCEKSGSTTVNPPSDCNQLFPTQTDCNAYLNCDTSQFVQEYLCVTISKFKGKSQITNVIPGAFFYYGDFFVEQPMDGSNPLPFEEITIVLHQDVPDGLVAFNYFNDANVNIYNANCGSITPSFIDASDPANIIIKFTPAEEGTYVLGVKLDPKTLVGISAAVGKTFDSYSIGMFIDGVKEGTSFGSLGIDTSNGCKDEALPPANNCEIQTSSSELIQSTQSIQAESLSIETVENDVSVSPVPFDEEISVSYDLNYTSDVTIEIFDFGGNLLRTVKDSNVSKGSSTSIGVDFSISANQMYLLRVTTDREQFVKQIVSSKK